MAVNPGSGHEFAAAIQLNGVAALDRHLNSGVAGNCHTTSPHPILTLASLLCRRGFLRGRLVGGREVFLPGGCSSWRLACSRAPKGSREKLATRAVYSASEAALEADALASAARKSRL
jgi:hypothetical protein